MPDVVIEWGAGDELQQLLIEVTVTNPFTAERTERISSLGLPVLEIDIGRMGGVVTRDELRRLVVDELAGKRWLYHPVIPAQQNRLIAEMKLAEARAVAAAERQAELQEIPVKVWALRFLEGIHARWNQEWKGEVGNDEHQDAEIQIADSIEGLVAHGYGMGSYLEQDPLRSIVARILSIRLGTGVTYKCTDVWPVLNAIRCDGPRAKRWHTLYLIALREYRPWLSEDHQTTVADWRSEVIASINRGEETYIRDDRYDGLIGILFPEMQSALSMFFGTIQQPSSRTRDAANTVLPATNQRSVFLEGKALEEWKQRHPDAAKAWMNSPAGKHFRSSK